MSKKPDGSFCVGNGILQPESPRQRRLGGKFFVVAQPPKGGKAEVFEYEDSPEGLADMSSLIRGEKIIKVIFGEEVTFKSESVVHVVHGEDHIVDRKTIAGKTNES